VREQHASNLLGLHVQAGDPLVVQRLTFYSRVLARAHGDHEAIATTQLARVVRVAATTQSVIDSYVALAAGTVLALVLLALLDAPPGAPSLLKRRRGT
jgi:hypothetical protein